MISFRYHLVSIVAVLLALGIGIVLGSGFLGGVLLERLRGDVARVAEDNDELRAQLAEQSRTLTGYEEFARQVEVELIGGALATREVVVLTVDGTDEGTLNGLGEALEIAGASVASTVRITDKLGLEEAEDRSELAFVLGTSARGANELRRQLGIALGAAAAAAAAPEPGARRQGIGPPQDLERLLRRLTESRFLAVDRPLGEPVVPSVALFLVVEGGGGDPLPRPLTFTRPLALNLARRGAAVLVAEPSVSTWGVVAGVRADERATDQVATVDHAESPPGRVATVLGLRRATLGRPGHYGTDPGAEAIVPRLAPLAG
jgi:hypothetical protein